MTKSFRVPVDKQRYPHPRGVLEGRPFGLLKGFPVVRSSLARSYARASKCSRADMKNNFNEETLLRAKYFTLRGAKPHWRISENTVRCSSTYLSNRQIVQC